MWYGLPFVLAFWGATSFWSGPDRDRALLEAARRGDAARTEALVREGANVNARDERGQTPLLLAAREGQAGVVKALLRAGASLDAATASGLTPLIAAAAKGRTDIARLLIEARADPDARHRELGTALDAAQRNGHRDIVQLLRQRGARGSGKSVGDSVCVRLWSGSGFCGVIEDATASDYRLGITRVEGCPHGCSPDDDCSAGRRVGGGDRDAVRVGAEVWVKSWCLTHTALPSEP
jgi:hypothetical protein